MTIHLQCSWIKENFLIRETKFYCLINGAINGFLFQKIKKELSPLKCNLYFMMPRHLKHPIPQINFHKICTKEKKRNIRSPFPGNVYGYPLEKKPPLKLTKWKISKYEDFIFNVPVLRRSKPSNAVGFMNFHTTLFQFVQ